MGQAGNAHVLLDGNDIGTVGEISHFRAQVGKHSLDLLQDGYIAPGSPYTIEIEENRLLVKDVSMNRFASYCFTSTPADARVSIDGEYIGNTPTKPYTFIETEKGHAFEVVIEHDGHLKSRTEILPDYSKKGVIEQAVELIPTQTFSIKTDETDLLMLIREKRKGEVLVEGTAPSDVQIPLSKKPYYIELYRPGIKSPAWKGRFRFSNPKKNSRYFQTYSPYDFQLISGNYFLNAPLAGIGGGFADATSGETVAAKMYKPLGNISLMKLRLFNGFSTSMVRGTLFMGEDRNVPIGIDDGANQYSVGSGLIKHHFLPALSILLINGEFRMGGALFDYMDVNAVATYAWYPDIIKEVIGFSHIVGHDVFVGGEITSRIPYFNVNLKMGLQMYPGLKANIYDKETFSPTSSELRSAYRTVDVDLPPTMFVISVGFSLGGYDAKGNNLLRLF